MEKSVLANQLRERQQGNVPTDILEALSDDQVVASYITCSHCGVQQITDEQAEHVISLSTNVLDFMRLWPQFAKHTCYHTPQN